MKSIIFLFAIMNLSISYSQSSQNFYMDTIQYDSIRHIQTYRLDSTLFANRVFKFDDKSQRYKFIQSITYTEDGMMDTFHSVYDMNINDEGYISTDEVIVKLDVNGKPIKLWWVDKFKLFKAYKYTKEKDKYIKIKMKTKK